MRKAVSFIYTVHISTGLLLASLEIDRNWLL